MPKTRAARIVNRETCKIRANSNFFSFAGGYGSVSSQNYTPSPSGYNSSPAGIMVGPASALSMGLGVEGPVDWVTVDLEVRITDNYNEDDIAGKIAHVRSISV